MRTLLSRGAVALILVMLVIGCHKPTAGDRDNRRLLDEILTAITIKNSRLLEEAAKRAEARHIAGQLVPEDYQRLAAVIEIGRKGDWATAEQQGYAFRRQRPFVRPGE